ncbi:carboxylic acid reductase [Amycolatopsis sp. NPDC088138]|uniref:carboxylic acid reductase n=1 Tax=Amycolatopsis sp. NPDC088138 TaxID=3363938 RepID=UPI0037F54341
MATADQRDQAVLDRRAELFAQDAQFAAAAPREDVTEAVLRPSAPLLEIVEAVMTAYADRPAVGERATEAVTEPGTGRTTRRLLPRFATTTYGELWRRAGAVAAAWHHDERDPVRAGDFVATLGFTSGDYATLDLACVRLGAVAVPLQAGAALGQLRPIIEETGPRVLATSVEHLEAATELVLGAASVRRVVVFDHHPDVDEEREAIEAARARLTGVVLETLPQLLDRDAGPLPAVTADEERLSLLIYTSGSTGTPKGAMYPARLVAELWRGFFPERAGLPLLGVNFMPMSHIAGRAVLFGTLSRGGTSFFVARSDLSTLFEDIALARPTEVMFVPRICDMLFQRYQSELGRGGTDVKARLRDEVLGGRILWAASGSAPLSAELTTFVESVLGLPLHDGYGSTEAGGVLFDHKLMRERVLDYRLDDVPDLGYFHTDAPHPRGELLIRSNTLIPGYYHRPDATAEVFTEDGFYRTGDVMAQTGPDELVYLDRRKNVLKLSQGEFVAVSRLEALFAASPVIRQIYVYGSSERAYLLAVAVPTPEALERAGGDVKALLLDSLQRIAKDEDLNSYEIPRDLLVETEPFTTENGLLSGIRKLQRPKLKEHYGERLERRYAELAERETDELQRLRASGRDRPVLETVTAAAAAVLGTTAGDLGPDVHFTDLGGDSLSALTLSNLLQEIFAIEVPVGVVVSPANDLGALAEYVTRNLAGSERPTVAGVHGPDATEVRAADLTLDKFFDAGTLAAAESLPRPAGPTRTVLLTGANGYLGRFLCLEWLERLAPEGGKLVCVVRGRDDAAARARLDAAFDSGDAALSRHYRELADAHLEVLAGDLGEPRFDLEPATWQRLAESVDLVVHPAALVNHVLPYAQLFGPNVLGTAEVIRLALTTKLKPVTYLSTVGVLTGDAATAAEDTDVRRTSPTRPLDDGYANGYSNSKWAGEVLLREAHDLCGLPVATFRSDMILAHSRYTGQLNVPDMFTRLLLSLIVTGIAPRSFYRTSEPAHYDGLPADFTAAAITTLGAGVAKGYETYNVLNPHEDGISLDTYVDWLVEAGHPITRIDDYGTWFARFETAIRALPDRQKQHSLLPLLHAFAVPAEAVPGSGIPADHFRSAVREAEVGPERDIPHVTAELIAKYAADLTGLGLL